MPRNEWDMRMKLHHSSEQDTTLRHRRLWKMFNAQSIAFVGGAGVVAAVDYLRDLGFGGQVAVVNQVRTEVAGVPSVRTVADLPFLPDVAFVAVNRHAAIDVVRDLAARNVNAIVCNTSGFAELGEDGKSLQQDLVQAAGSSLLIGPNCNGFVNYLGRVAAMVGHMGIQSDKKGAALISQGGGFLVDMALSRRSLPMSYIIGTGNQAMIGAADCIRAVLEDDRVTAIGLYIEGSIDVERLSEAAASALERTVPIVVLKSGASAAGARVVLSHTASIAGENDLVDALFDRLGFIRVQSTSELIETLKFLTISGVPAGSRTGIVSSSGVESALAGDAAQAAGLDVPQLEPAVRDALRVALPEIATPNNPIDLTTAYWGDYDKQRECCTIFMRGRYDVVVEVATYPPPGTRPREGWDISVDSFVEAVVAAETKGAIICSLAESLPQDVRERVIARQVTPLQGTQDGMRAIANAARYGTLRKSIQEDGFRSVLLPTRAQTRGAGTNVLDEVTAKAALAKAGIPIPLGAVVQIGHEPSRLNFDGPYAVKLLSTAITHKTEVGGVRLGVNDERAVQTAIAEIRQSISKAAPHIDATHFLVEQMIADAVGEILLGIRQDPHLGLFLFIGAGGIMVELLRDRAILLLPTTQRSIEASLDRLKIASIFSGIRGRPRGDLRATVKAIMTFAAYAQANAASIVECEVNPLIILSEGRGVVAVDAVLIHARQ